MTVEALQDYVFCTKYARFNKDLGRRESWSESVDRVMDMHAEKYAGKGVEKEIDFCRQAIKEKLVLGSQRALQFGGKPIARKNARLYNCTVSYADRPRFIAECLWLLLCGCGTGFSVQKHHIAKLPNLVKRKDDDRPLFTIPDTIEGWADGLDVLMASYGICSPGMEKWAARAVRFSYKQIRPKGSDLSSGVGKAPGPEPLKASMEKIEALLEACVNARDRLRPIDVYDIIMHASDAVLAGGVRRSATICIFSKDDEEMAKAKTGDWFDTNPQRGRSNNSALLLRDSTSREEFDALMKSVKDCGEPGFVWADSTEILYNPCVEIGLYPTITGKDFNAFETSLMYPENEALSGWAFCNLCEINMKACKTVEIWERACTAAAILGTLQAGYTDFAYLGPVSEAIAKREALLGVSMTGMMDGVKLAFDPSLQRRMAKLVLEVNAAFAPRVGVLPTARATCVKPAGTTSCILGTSSGIHAHHAKRYFRRTQANELEGPLQYFALHNPSHVETSVWSANKTDKSITFCIETEPDAYTKQTVSALKQLGYVKLTQENWVAAGRNAERCAAPFLRHNVSNTINVQPDEWDAVADYIFKNRAFFAGVSLLPASGDRSYAQAPFVQVFTAAELLEMYGDAALMGSGLIVDGHHAFADNLWAACDCVQGVGEALDPDTLRSKITAAHGTPVQARWDEEGLTAKTPKRLLTAWLKDNVTNYAAKVDWIRRANKFAKNYFGSDVTKMTMALKDLENFKRWIDLQRVYQPVDWSLFREDSDQTASPTLDAACGGAGGCEIK